MRITDITRMAWSQIKRRKVVTALCMTGLSIGCAAIIVAISIGDSAQGYLERELNRNFKMDEITVMPGGAMPQQGGNKSGGIEVTGNMDPGKLTDEKLKIIQGLNHVTAATPFQELGYMQLTTMDNRNNDVQVLGTDLTLLTKYDHKFKQGRPSVQPGTVVFDYGSTVGLMDAETRQKLYDQMGSDPFNMKVREQFETLNMKPSDMMQQQVELVAIDYSSPTQNKFTSSPLRVVGVLENPQGSDPMRLMYEKKIYVSLETAELLKEELNVMGGSIAEAGVYNSAIVKVDSKKNIVQVEQMIQKLSLSTQTNLFQEVALKDQLDMLKKAAIGIGIFILVIASISIIVAMTMSTHQRRRQIGIMKVLGSNMGQVRNMFIMEAALLGMLGGLLGIGFSYLITMGLTRLIGSSMGMGEALVIEVPLMSLPVGMAFAIMTGVLSGIYPAISASRTNALTAIKRD
ncbi:ABC transporter permease [Paenibacillus donghaensis]|nr:ABC transporter permease [Paenibacillus donghaensis]